LTDPELFCDTVICSVVETDGVCYNGIP